MDARREEIAAAARREIAKVGPPIHFFPPAGQEHNHRGSSDVCVYCDRLLCARVALEVAEAETRAVECWTCCDSLEDGGHTPFVSPEKHVCLGEDVELIRRPTGGKP